MITKKDWRYVEREYSSERADVVYVSDTPYLTGDEFLEINRENMPEILGNLKLNLRLIDEVLLEYGMTVKDLRRFNPHE